MACENEKSNNKELLDISDLLIGEWQLVEKNESIGGGSNWESIKDGATFRLNSDVSYEGIFLHFQCATGTYEVTERELILEYDCPEYSQQFIYSLTRDGADIILSPRTVLCIEVCQYKYCRIEQ